MIAGRLPALTLAAAMLLATGAATGAGEAPFKVLVFSKTEGFRHDSIPAGQALLQSMAESHGFEVRLSEDLADFTADSLAGFAVVVFLNTTGDVLDEATQVSLGDFVRGGGGFVGVHAAADTEYEWPFYGELIGGDAWFHSHPAIQTAQLDVERRDDASSRHLPARFGFQDEWYNFRTNPRPAVSVLLRLDESSFDPGSGAMGSDHPIAWKCHIGKGRSFYTGLGHRIETYADARFRRHLLGGLLWAAGDIMLSTGFEASDPSG